MTIRQYLTERILQSQKERLESLMQIGAPDIVIQSLKDTIDKGKVKIGGDQSLLDEEFQTIEQKKGNGGKPYYIINEYIRFFPKAKYGMFITRD